MPEVDVFAFVAEVEKGDPVLQVTDLVANRNLVGRTKNAVPQGFVENGDFFEYFCFIHTNNIKEKPRKSKKNFQLFYCLILLLFRREVGTEPV